MLLRTSVEIVAVRMSATKCMRKSRLKSSKWEQEHRGLSWKASGETTRPVNEREVIEGGTKRSIMQGYWVDGLIRRGSIATPDSGGNKGSSKQRRNA